MEGSHGFVLQRGGLDSCFKFWSLHWSSFFIYQCFTDYFSVSSFPSADMKVTQKSFNFARKFSLPFYFVSAADGTNVVKVKHSCLSQHCTVHGHGDCYEHRVGNGVVPLFGTWDSPTDCK